MLSASRAARLALTAERAAPHPAENQLTRPGWQARRAWRVLKDAAGAGDRNAIEAVWQSWLRHPDDERWDLLNSWEAQEDLAGAVFAAAMDPDRVPGERAAIGEFCARHSMRPHDDIRQVLFHVLTGQAAQYRAADPDGRLLAVAYRNADPAVRAVLRAALATTGDLDLIWVMAGVGSPARAAQATGEESEYLIRQLAARSDWDRLWQLARELPLTSAVMAMRDFGGGWRPAARHEQVLFERLARADPGQLARARDALTAPSVTRVTLQDGLSVMGGAISADGRRLGLVSIRSPESGSGGTISLHDLPEGKGEDPARHGPAWIDPPAIGSSSGIVRLSFAGDALIAARTGYRMDSPYAVLRYERGRLEPLSSLRAALGGSMVFGLAPCSTPTGGFAVLCERSVALCEGDGRLAKRVPLSVSLEPSFLNPLSSLLDTESGGRVAVVGLLDRGRSGWEVHDAGTGRVVASAPCPGRPYGIHFLSSNRLITTSRFRDACDIRLWQLDGAQTRLLAATSVAMAYHTVVIPGRGQIGVLDALGRVRLLDAATLTEAGILESRKETLVSQWNSADKRICGFGGEGFADVFPGRRTTLATADRPPAEWEPADRAAVTAALGDPAVSAAARPLLELLHAALEYRFGSEVSIGGAVPMESNPDDIGLA
jgi:hypothetical protein